MTRTTARIPIQRRHLREVARNLLNAYDSGAPAVVVTRFATSDRPAVLRPGPRPPGRSAAGKNLQRARRPA